jgi:hypothetical protein
MADTGKVVIGLGVLAVGGYLVYEYMQYSSAIAQYVTQSGTDRLPLKTRFRFSLTSS